MGEPEKAENLAKNDKHREMEDLVNLLSNAAEAYYNANREIMSNWEYDEKYDRLLLLEGETGTILSGSPTVKVGYETADNLPKEKHLRPMLSLDKTKEVVELANFADQRRCMLSRKLDGITIVLTYEGGKLQKAVTRGNGTVGEVVTGNAKTFVNIPLIIPFKGRAVLRGEALITYKDFEEINRKIPELDAKYKNPRNLCSGSVRQLSSKVTAQRRVRFVAFSLVEGPIDEKSLKTVEERQLWLRDQGFEIVDYVMVDRDSIGAAVEKFRENMDDSAYPSDGLVLCYDDIEYGQSLGRTAKFPRDAIAFKWQDERKPTILKEIKWNTSRTGLINPIAIFEPVYLEGTTVSRASVHNVSIVKELELAIGDEILVYKANMIIPQIADNLTRSGNVKIPPICGVCSCPAVLREENDVKTLYCTNPKCPAKMIKSFALFTSRDALNIEGLSEATIAKLTQEGAVKTPADFFGLGKYEEEITSMEGFGEKSYKKLLKSAEKSRHTTPARLIYGLGIPGIGTANARQIADYCDGDFYRIMSLNEEELTGIVGIGHVMATAFVNYFNDPEKKSMIEELLPLIFMEEALTLTEEELLLKGMTFVVTGSLKHFENREVLKGNIKDKGGKVSGTVSRKTDFLINNDVNSPSGKNKKARELGVPVISEEEFMNKFGIK